MRLHEAVHWRRLEVWPNVWVLHHNNATAHDAIGIQELLSKNLILKLDHPLYSPDLTSCELWVFTKLKSTSKGHRFSDIANI